MLARMTKTVAVVAAALWLAGCGGESSTDGGGATGGGGSGGAGASGGSSGSGGVVGGSGGALGGSGGATGGSGGSGGAAGGGGGSGVATGGSGGSTGGTGGGGPAKPECTSDSECKVFTDCCSCIGVPTSENPPSCPALCVQDKCGELGAPKAAACIAGRCVMGFPCDDSKVTCKMATPNCDPGQVPQVTADGTCWTGQCVPADECKTVKDCTDCTGALFCASYVTQLGPQNHCVDVPASCGSDFTCACSGPSVCVAPYATCSDFSGLKGVSCSCPNC
ncbi:MAG: hypothetical protein AMXMBFR56_07290 [Polyangiaceae bacterium]